MADEPRVKLRVLNNSIIGSHGGTLKIDLIDEFGNVVAQLKRFPEEKRKLKYFFTDFIGSKGVIKNKQYDLSSSFEILTSKTAPDLLIPPGLKVLYGDLNLPLSINNKFSGLGKLMFEDALKYFSKNTEIDGVYGYWIKKADLYSEYGGESINLTKFKNSLEQGKSENDAALSTITGDWAQQFEFQSVKILYRNSDNSVVKVLFTK